MKNEIFNQSIKYHDSIKRNITLIAAPRNAFATISDDEEDLTVIDATSKLARMSTAAENSLADFYYSAAIGYPFRTVPFMRTRYSDGTYPVWYGSGTIETSIYETAYHMVRFLQAEDGAMREKRIIKKRSVFDVFCKAILIDLRAKTRAFTSLEKDDYTFTNAVGKQIKDGGMPGILYSSRRHKDGMNAAIFQQSVLESPQLLGQLTYIVLPAEKIIRVNGLKLKFDIHF